MFDSCPGILDHKDTNLNCILNSHAFSAEPAIHNINAHFNVPVKSTNDPPGSYVTRSSRVAKPTVIVSV